MNSAHHSFHDNSCTLEVQAADEDLLARQHVYSDCINVGCNILNASAELGRWSYLGPIWNPSLTVEGGRCSDGHIVTNVSTSSRFEQMIIPKSKSFALYVGTLLMLSLNMKSDAHQLHTINVSEQNPHDRSTLQCVCLYMGSSKLQTESKQPLRMHVRNKVVALRADQLNNRGYKSQ